MNSKTSSKVLFINSTPKSKHESITLTLAHELVEAYKTANPNDEVIELNLYQEDIKFLDRNAIDQFLSGDPDQIDFIRYTNQFIEADKYVFAAPMWNLSIPAILSAYLDYINIVGMTFYYTERGVMPLLNDRPRRAVYVSSRGGGYKESPLKEFEFAESFLQKQLEFFGITDFQMVLMEWADVLKDQDLENAKLASIERAREVGRTL